MERVVPTELPKALRLRQGFRCNRKADGTSAANAVDANSTGPLVHSEEGRGLGVGYFP